LEKQKDRGHSLRDRVLEVQRAIPSTTGGRGRGEKEREMQRKAEKERGEGEEEEEKEKEERERGKRSDLFYKRNHCKSC
jgi:ribosomal protein L12E/L44/L45/RPP1/RPP2